MADDIQTLEEELNDLFAEVDRVLKALATLSGRDKDDVCFPSSLWCALAFVSPMRTLDSNSTTAGTAQTASSEVCTEHRCNTGTAL